MPSKKRPAPFTGDNKEFQVGNDARILTEAHQIMQNKRRHGLAVSHMTSQAEAAKSTVAFHQKVRKGLAKAFPKDTAQSDQRNPVKKDAGGAC